ncbi:Thiamine-triphosphatase, partial [Takifugu flavidus]
VAVTQCQFHDKYFDNPQFDLTLADTWLREREGRWELKCPTLFERTAKTNVAGELCTRYKEITNLSEIHLKVKEVIKDYEDGERGPSLQEEDAWLQRFQLVCFAEFTTIRRSFVLEEEGVRVDLDQADFGYSVGEIEVLVPEGGDVKSALGRIERIAQKLVIQVIVWVGSRRPSDSPPCDPADKGETPQQKLAVGLDPPGGAADPTVPLAVRALDPV